ncbi:MAG: NAD(P)H-dependent oxidoreductase subunit E [Peptoniphilus sp. oral taxon 375]|nr:NAD(P)H-dependent oxidoreductase subunit E [Peptoniphilus sp. oral taxon 375]
MLEEKFDQEKLNTYFTFLNDLIDSGEKGINIKILQKIQETFGYIPEEVLFETSKRTNIPASTLYGAATFYHQFSFQPKGRYEIQLCLGTACYVKGAGNVLEELQSIIGIEGGQVTDDGMFSLDTTRCVGACGLAPVMSINGKIYGKCTPAKVHEIIDNIRENDHE